MGKKHFKNRIKEGHGSIHHIVPTSREGPYEKWNEYPWSRRKHQAWHHLFFNFLPSTCIAVIKDWTGQDGRLLPHKIGKRNIEDWKVVFGSSSLCPEDGIEFIEREFLPAEIIFLKMLKGQQ